MTTKKKHDEDDDDHLLSSQVKAQTPASKDGESSSGAGGEDPNMSRKPSDKEKEAKEAAGDKGKKKEEEKDEDYELEDVMLKDVKVGDTLVATGHDLNCVHDEQEFEVKQDDDGTLVVDCDEGQHRLKADDHGWLQTFSLKKKAYKQK